MTLDELFGNGDGNALARHYARFDVANRLLFTGHSHQAWPDVAREGQLLAWDAAARAVDGKWDGALERAERVARGYLDRLGDDEGSCALGANTHELVVRLLSALPLSDRPRIVTTDGEYHSARRQLDRLAEEGLEVARIPAAEPEAIAPRLAAAVDARTALVVVSHVLFRTGAIVPGLGEVARACAREGAALLVDMYHTLNAVPVSLRAEGLTSAFVVGGGYKYMQLGEGNAFLRVPPNCTLRPVITGWYAEFSSIADPKRPDEVAYGRGAARFAGATYDPTSQYRAAPVLDFFAAHGLTPAFLREVSQHQVGRLAALFDAQDHDPDVVARDRSRPLSAFGGFLALRSRHAGVLHDELKRRGVLTDHRDDVLRLGPAPYLADAQLRAAMEIFGEAVRRLSRGSA